MVAKADHRDCFRRLIQVVGNYPVGSIVELNTGEVAIVKQIHPHVPLTPVVLLVKSAGDTLLSSPHEQISPGKRRHHVEASQPSYPLNKQALARLSTATRKPHKTPHC